MDWVGLDWVDCMGGGGEEGGVRGLEICKKDRACGKKAGRYADT